MSFNNSQTKTAEPSSIRSRGLERTSWTTQLHACIVYPSFGRAPHVQKVSSSISQQIFNLQDPISEDCSESQSQKVRNTSYNFHYKFTCSGFIS